MQALHLCGAPIQSSTSKSGPEIPHAYATYGVGCYRCVARSDSYLPLQTEDRTLYSPGVVSSYAGLIVIRAILGAVEGPMFPGIVLFSSGFYTRSELSLRLEFSARVRFLEASISHAVGL